LRPDAQQRQRAGAMRKKTRKIYQPNRAALARR
jgi:hypothetical protein